MIVTVTPLDPTPRVSLRTRAPEAVGAAIGVELPTRVGRRAVAGELAALCLGPDEWTVTGASSLALPAGVPASAVEVSDRELTLDIAGPGVLDLLATGCPLDLAKMPVGAGTRTVFDTAPVILVREAEDRFRLTVWRSFLPHVRALLDLGMRELAIGL